MRAKIGQRHAPFDRNAVVQHVEFRFPEIDHTLAAQVLHVRVLDVPLSRDSLIKYLGTSRDIVDLDRNVIF